MHRSVHKIIAIVGMSALGVFMIGRGNLAYFWDLHAFVFVFGVILFGGIGSFGMQPILLGLKFAVVGTGNRPDTLASYAAWKRMENISLPVGVLVTVIGLILMLQNLSDPSQLGPGMATSMLGLLYSVVLEIGCFGLIANAIGAPADSSKDQSQTKWWAVVSLVLILLVFFLLMLTVRAV